MLFPSISTSLFSNFLTSLFFNFYFPFACVTTLIAFSFFAVVCFHTDIICSLFQTARFKTVSVQYIFLCFFRSEGRCRRNFHPVPMYHFATRISNHKRFLVFLQFLNFRCLWHNFKGNGFLSGKIAHSSDNNRGFSDLKIVPVHQCIVSIFL